MSDLEKRIADLERRVSRIEPHVERTMPLGPDPEREREMDKQRTDEFKKICEEAKRQLDERNEKKGNHPCAEVPPVDRSQTQLTDGKPVTDDHRDINPATGMQKGYVVLTPEERAKGFVRPVRTSYQHVGKPTPRYPLRDLTPEEVERWGDAGYVKFEPYPGEEDICNGRFWMQSQFDAVGNGCGTVTTMGQAIAETYARSPNFYGGTFCAHCGSHFSVGKNGEFVWGDGTRVGT